MHKLSKQIENYILFRILTQKPLIPSSPSPSLSSSFSFLYARTDSHLSLSQSSFASYPNSLPFTLSHPLHTNVKCNQLQAYKSRLWKIYLLRLIQSNRQLYLYLTFVDALGLHPHLKYIKNIIF